ncbi:DJ-1/PfpI family protein [Marinibaculum pumilum]|uniref:DJ-1/PfpI family protein n=1 Tax=Marinibaculum pumilum TaxID=1766165 RepID=A0ABV7KZH3_9PROT
MKVLSFVFPGFTFIDLAAPMQAFGMLPDVQCQTVWHEKGPVPSDAGVTVLASHGLEDCWQDPDILFVPGNTKALFAQLEDDRTLDFVADRGARAGWVTSVCNGSLLLGAAGLLQGYRAASYWYARESLALFGAIPTDARVVIDRNRATGGGMTAGVDFGIAMIGQIMGEEAGRLFELLFEYAPEPPFGTGRPELAPAETLAAARGQLAELMPLERLQAVRDRRQPAGAD